MSGEILAVFRMLRMAMKLLCLHDIRIRLPKTAVQLLPGAHKPAQLNAKKATI